MSEYYKFPENPHEKEDEVESLLRGIDLQICLMRIIKSQLESCLREDDANVKVREIGNRYGKSGYMADVELDDRGEVSAIRYDWVEP